MEAKDTVLKTEWMSKEVAKDQNALLLKQAEISFQRGKQIGFEIGIEQGKAEGRREVVKWINNLIIGIEGCKFEERLDGDKGCVVLDMNENQWQAQKKDWGIK